MALPLIALHAGEPALARTPEPPTIPPAPPASPLGIEAASATPAAMSVRQEERGCCNGMGGPEEPEVVVEHLADPGAEWRRWVAPIDPNLERRFAPRPAPSLNPIALRF